MSAFPALEEKLDRLYAEWTPELPGNGRRALAQYLPWLSLIGGLLSLYTAYTVWHWAHGASQLITYSNTLNVTYDSLPAVGNRLSFGIWLGIVVLLILAALYGTAVRALRDRQQRGWDLLFYAMLLNAAYGFIIMLTAHGDFGSFVVRVIGSAIGLYALLQVRKLYTIRRPQPAAAAKKRARTRRARPRPKRKKA